MRQEKSKHVYDWVPLSLGLIFRATDGEANARTVFVENGVPKNIREIGLGWEF